MTTFTFTFRSARYCAAGLLLAAAGTLAQAEPARTTKMLHLRAGPARDYPVVAILPAGLAIEVQGCLADYTWCDVIAGVERGWVYAANIDYAYQGREVPVLGYGRAIGIAIVAFALFDYWGEHYRAHPWYRDRDRWAHPPRPAPQPRAPVRPPPRPRDEAPPPRPVQPAPPRAGTPGEHRAPPPQGAPRAPVPQREPQPGPHAPTPHAAPPAPHPPAQHAPQPGEHRGPGERRGPGGGQGLRETGQTNATGLHA